MLGMDKNLFFSFKFNQKLNSRGLFFLFCLQMVSTLAVFWCSLQSLEQIVFSLFPSRRMRIIRILHFSRYLETCKWQVQIAGGGSDICVLVWTLPVLSAYIKKVLGLPPPLSPKEGNTFTHWHGCANAHLHHPATFVRDKCVSSTPHKLKWERFVIWIEAKQFKYPSLTPHTSCVTTFHACVVPSFPGSLVLNWWHFFSQWHGSFRTQFSNVCLVRF